jgi:hypothetical protein
VTVFSLGVQILAGFLAVLPAQQPPSAGAPAEAFDMVGTVTPQGASAAGAITVPMVVQILRYTPDHALTTMTDALKYGGYPGFLKALRESEPAGTLEVAGQKFVIRWARQQPSEAGRRVTFITDQPVYFVGSGRQDAKSTKGYELAVIQLSMDASGKGEGTLAAAARVKPKDVTGVQLDDYAQTPIRIKATARPLR